MMVKTQMEKISAADYRGPAIITYLFKNPKELSPDQGSFDRRARGLIGDTIKSGHFLGEKYEVCTLFDKDNKKGLRRLILVGLGNPDDFEPDVLRTAAMVGIQQIQSTGTKEAASTLLDHTEKILSLEQQAQYITEGAIIGSYRFEDYRSEKKERPAEIETFTLLCKNMPPLPVKEGIAWGWAIGSGVNYARNLANHPANIASPEFLANEALQMAKHYSQLRCKVLERAEIEKLGMGAFLSVNQGSHRERPLKLIVLELRGRSQQNKRGGGRSGKTPKIGLIGKGITFDSGGLSIKNAQSMEDMKYDMSGGAAVLGMFRVLAEKPIAVNVVGMIPLTENMPDAGATRPGDVVKSLSGKTIEILNTDAEGRLVLADTLSYMQQQKVDLMLDFATLTGACMVALGLYTSGMFANNNALAEQLVAAGKTSGDKVWRLPLAQEYHDMLKSRIADMKNVGGKWAGACTAAAFLEKFVEDVPWAHIDIAGTSDVQEKKTGWPNGASGVGVRLAIEFMRKYKPIS
jgi:leucyl aminopeptidase